MYAPWVKLIIGRIFRPEGGRALADVILPPAADLESEAIAGAALKVKQLIAASRENKQTLMADFLTALSTMLRLTAHKTARGNLACLQHRIAVLR